MKMRILIKQWRRVPADYTRCASIVVVCTVLLFGSGCNNCPCIDRDDISINFIGYEAAQVDTVILKKFTPGFAQLVDSFTFDRAALVFRQMGDTISFPARPGSFAVAPGFDYVVRLPAVGRETRISNLRSEQVTGSCAGKVQCVNPVTSALIDGNTYLFEAHNPELFLRR